MKKLLLMCCLFVLIGVEHPHRQRTWVIPQIAEAQEVVTLTTKITHPDVASFKIDKITIDVTNLDIYVQWFGNTGEAFSANYPTPPPVDHPTQPSGQTLLTSLDKGNFGVNSLVKQIFLRLQADGYIGAGTITGTAQ